MLRSIGLTSLIAILLTSCGGAPPVGPTEASGTVNQAQATALKTQLDQLLNTINGTSIQNPGTIVTIPGVSQNSLNQQVNSPYDACTTITPANLVDADGDGLAARKTTIFNCRGIVLPGHAPANRVGSFVLVDDDTIATSDAGPYSMEYDVEFSSDDGYQSIWNGEHSLTRPSGNVLFSARYLSTFQEPNGTRGGLESNYTQLMEPTDTAAPFVEGVVDIQGFYRLILVGEVTVDQQTMDVDWDVTFEMTSDGLEYEDTNQSGCLSFYKAGYFAFHDSSRNFIRYDYTCDSIIYSFNGTQISVTGAPE